MSYHDKRLSVRRTQLPTKTSRKRLFLEGINSISLFQSSPRIRRGSLMDDWRAIGRDFRCAIETVKRDG